MRTEDFEISRAYALKVAAMAVAIGLLAGLFSVLFHMVVASGIAFVDNLIARRRWTAISLPFVVYLALYFANRHLQRDAVFGVQAVERELKEISRLVMQVTRVALKMTITMLALICGFAVGQFGPTVYLGGAIGANVGYYLKLRKSLVRLLIGCGAAAAISAVMQLPLFATIFTVEIIFAKRYFDYMLPVSLASLVAYGFDGIFNPRTNLFGLAALEPLGRLTMTSWLVLIVLAIGLGIISSIYIQLLKAVDRKLMSCHRVKRLYFALALIFAVIYFIMPELLRVDIAHINHIADMVNGWRPLLLLLMLRLLLTALQLGSGVYGGNFSPGLIIGILFGSLVYTQIPAGLPIQLSQLHITTFSVVAMLSGFAHAPISAVILAIESSGQTDILIPALTVATLSHLLSSLLSQEGVYDLK